VAELVTHYTDKEMPNKTPCTAEVYAGYLKTWIQPRWDGHSLSDVRTVAVETWLGTLPLADGTKAKLRNLMHALYNYAMRWEFFDRNPITLVRQSAKRTRVPEVLTVEEVGKLIGELADPWRTAVYVAVTTGLRVSELLGLKWADVEFTEGEIRLSRGVVRQHIGVGAVRTINSRTTSLAVPTRTVVNHTGLLRGWKITFDPLLFGLASESASAGMSHVWDAVKRAKGRTLQPYRRSCDHANASITMNTYVQPVTPAKREAQNRVVNSIPFPNVPRRLTDSSATA
jgi:integrase